MIFLTVGSEIGFDRLVEAVDVWCGTNRQYEVFGQLASISKDSYIPKNFEWQEFVSPRKYQELYNKAELIIGHAGMGSIITALVVAKPILIMPRKCSLRETRNDHQLSTADQFASRKGVFVAIDEQMVGAMLNKWSDQKNNLAIQGAGEFAAPQLVKAISDFIFQRSEK